MLGESPILRVRAREPLEVVTADSAVDGETGAIRPR